MTEPTRKVATIAPDGFGVELVEMTMSERSSYTGHSGDKVLQAEHISRYDPAAEGLPLADIIELVQTCQSDNRAGKRKPHPFGRWDRRAKAYQAAMEKHLSDPARIPFLFDENSVA